MTLSVKVTHYPKSKRYRALIFNGEGKILGNATCQNCPRVAANAAVAKTFGLPAAATITEIPANLAWAKRGSENEVFFYRFTFDPSAHELKKS